MGEGSGLGAARGDEFGFFDFAEFVDGIGGVAAAGEFLLDLSEEVAGAGEVGAVSGVEVGEAEEEEAFVVFRPIACGGGFEDGDGGVGVA